MCEPTTIMVVASLAVAAVGAYAAYQSGETQKDFAEFEGKQQQADAQAEVSAAQVEADRIRKAGKRAVAEANVDLASSGVQLSSAGALAINREIYRGSAEDAYFASIGGRDRAARLNMEAGLSKMRGKAASQAGKLGAYSTALQGASNASSAWRSGNQGGMGARGG